MKRAFLFSVIFILLFTVFLLLSVFYLRMLQMDALNLAQTKNITKSVYIADNVMSDLLDYLQLSVAVQSNSTNTILNISDVLPSPYTDPNGALSGYNSFITGIYSNQTNSLNSTNGSAIVLNTTGFASNASIFFLNSNSSLNLNYTYNNLSKNQLIINGSSLITNYSITITLNTTCLNSNCTNATWAGGPPNIDSSTVGMWHLNDSSSSTAVDSSGNGNNGTIANPSWNLSGKFSFALNFNGASTYVNMSNASLFNSARTVSLWFYPLSNTTNQSIIDKSPQSAGYSNGYAIWIGNDGTLNCEFSNSSNSPAASYSLWTLNSWHQVTCVWDTNGSVELYYDGALVGVSSSTLSGSYSNTNSLYVGTSRNTNNFFNGVMEEIAVYNRTKAADEIAADANRFHWDWSPTAMNSNLSAVWHFDEGTGTNAFDSSGNGNNGTLGTATQGTPYWESGRFGYGLKFNNTNNVNGDAVSIGVTTPNVFTITAWIKPTLRTAWMGIVTKDGSTGFFVSSSNKIDWYAGGDILEGNTVLTSGNWYFVAMVSNGSAVTLYLNGVQDGQTSWTGVPIKFVEIGDDTSNEWFNGVIDEVAVYSRAKSAAEIAADANPLYVSLNITDSGSNQVSLRGITSGYVNPGANNTFYLKTSNSGSLNTTVGAYAGFYSFRTYVNNTQASLLFNITENGASSMQVVLPVQLQLYQQLFSNLIIAQK